MRKTTWDGNGGFVRTVYKAQPYATLVADARTNKQYGGNLIVWLRGGTCLYQVTCTNTFTATPYYTTTNVSYTPAYTDNVSPTTSIGNGGIFEGIQWYGNVTGNVTGNVAGNVTGNATTATKLQTPRTIWGQSFDGTANVSGDLNNVGDIISTGFSILGRNTENPYVKLSNTNVPASYFQLTTAGVLSMDFGSKSGKNISIVYDTGYVGIGTLNPSYKCHVNGTLYASGAATLGSTLSVAGRLSANGGIYTTDISGNGSALYLGNSNNSSYVYLREDMRSNTDTWTISKAGAATFITLSVSSTSTLTGSVTMGSVLSVRGNITCSSNISATGEIAAGSSSDRRLKTILDKQDYIKRLMDIGMVVDYEYNDLAFSRDVRSIERRRYTGLIYQNVKNVLPQMAGEDADGYGYLNYIHTDYINLIAGALQQTILKQENIEQRVERLEKENCELKQKLSKLVA